MQSELLHIVRIGWEACGPQWCWKRSGTSLRNWDLWYVVAGRGTLHFGNHSEAVTSGDAMLFPPELLVSAAQDLTDPLTVCYTWFSIDDPIPPCEERAHLHHPCRNPTFIAQCLQHAHHGAQADDLQQTTNWLAAVLGNIRDERDQQRAGLVGPYYHTITCICERIRADPSLRWTSDELANHIGTSSSHFNRLFRHQVGTSPRDFQIGVRMDRARSLLAFGDEPIAAIAERLGYPDQFTFSRQFRQRCGMSPDYWRRRERSGSLNM